MSLDLLQLAEHGPTQHVRQEHVERDGGRMIVVGERDRLGAGRGDEHLEAVVMRKIDEDAGIVRIVLDDQQDHVAGSQLVAIVGQLLERPLGQSVYDSPAGGPRALDHLRGPGRSDILERQVERERAALARRAVQLDLAAEQIGKLAADRQAEAGAAILAAGAGVGLLERLEDDLLLLGGNADAGIGDLEGDDGGGLAQDRMIGGPAACGPGDAQPHAAVLGELEGVGEQVLEHLLQALGVGDDAAAELRIELDVEREMAPLGLVAERARHRVEQVGEVDLLGIDRDGSRLDLGQIEDVADEVHEVGAGAVDGARELDLLVGQVAVGVLAELLAQNEDAVERRAQLVRHVGQELGLVLRGERQLRRLLLQGAAGLLDLLVLGLHLDVALGELLRLLLELLVGLLQLLLLRLQLAGELLGLRQQAFGLHRRLDAVEDDADAGRELLEEGEVRGIEIVQRGERDHRLDLVLEHDREDEEAARHRVEQRRSRREPYRAECR